MKILYTLGFYIHKVSLRLSGRSRLLFYFIILLSVITPIFDLLFFKKIAEFFTAKSSMNGDSELTIFVVEILLLLIMANLFKYVTKLQRLRYISKMIEIVGLRTGDALGGKVNWLRMVLLEFFNSVIAVVHILTISFCSLLLSPLLGAVLLLTVFISMIVIYLFYRREVFNQKKLFYNKKVNQREKGELTVLSRVKATESATVVLNVIFFIMFSALLYLSVVGSISADVGLIFLFLIRFVLTSLGLLLSSLIRLSRGWAPIYSQMTFLLKSL